MGHPSLVKDLKKVVFSLIHIYMRSVELLGILWVEIKMKDKREVGGGFRMGNTGKSTADSCQCMAKTTTIL